MLFSTPLFLYLFLAALMALYFIFRNNRWRRAVLVVFSLLFYAWGEPIYLFLMIGLVMIDYLFGMCIAERWGKPRNALVVLAVIFNLAILAFFTYQGFFLENLNLLCGTSIEPLPFKMPIGISFFTFQALSYVIDVYRSDVKPQKSFWRLLLYVSFFPQLIAGPIVRYKDIEASLEDRGVPPEEINEGLFRFSIGLVKKVLIADSCYTVLNAFLALEAPTVLGRWLAALVFTLQLYFDFSGYSDMAIGLGHIFGFTFLENFNYPLAANSATDFWRRWHISLGSFFRDYVYIPLGGNRRKQYRNILIVWCLTGMWHGASWNFLLWGLYYGIILLIEKCFLLKFFNWLPGAIRAVVTHLYTLFITVFGFAIFYFEKDLKLNLGYLFGKGTTAFSDLFTESLLVNNCVLIFGAFLLALPILSYITKAIRERLSYTHIRLFRTLGTLALLAIATIRMAGSSYSPFLYFRF